MRVSFVVDGFNLYHSVRAAIKHTGQPLKWLDIRGMCASLVSSGFGPGATLEDVYYFTALAHHLGRPDVVRRHNSFIEVLEDTGVEITKGRFKKKTSRGSLSRCHFFKPGWRRRLRIPLRSIWVALHGHEEKETDVAIAVKMMELGQRASCDALVVVSGDTDLCAAVDGVRRVYPLLDVRVAFPYRRYNKDLEKRAMGRFKISPRLMAAHQFPDPYRTKAGKGIRKPASW